MTIGQARQAALLWIRENSASVPGFRAAYLSGSTNWLQIADQLPPTSDVDVMIVTGEKNPATLRRKFIYRNVLLEASYLDEKRFHSCEEVLSDYHLAPSLATTKTIFDPAGFLSSLLEIVSREFARTTWVRQRIIDASSKVRRALGSICVRAPLHEQAMTCLFAAGIAAHVLLTAGLQNPTVRARFRAVRELLSHYGHEKFHEALMHLLGAGSVSVVRAEQHLANLAEAFDVAKTVRFAPFPFASDIAEIARPLSIDSNREWFERGFHREAMFWIAVTSCRCRQIIETGAPERLTADLTIGHAQLLADLGLSSPFRIQQRSLEIERMLPAICATAEEILTANRAVVS